MLENLLEFLANIEAMFLAILGTSLVSGIIGN